MHRTKTADCLTMRQHYKYGETQNTPFIDWNLLEGYNTSKEETF